MTFTYKHFYGILSLSKVITRARILWRVHVLVKSTQTQSKVEYKFVS